MTNPALAVPWVGAVGTGIGSAHAFHAHGLSLPIISPSTERQAAELPRQGAEQAEQHGPDPRGRSPRADRPVREPTGCRLRAGRCRRRCDGDLDG